MRISIHTYGTRGDVQPYIALGKELLRGGHAVQIVGPQKYGSLALPHGVPYEPLPDEMLDLLDSPEGKQALGGRGALAGLWLLKHIRPLMNNLLSREWSAAHAFWPDMIIYHPKSIASPHMAERVGCRSVLASPLPILTPTSAFPTPMVPFRTLGPLNRASHRLTEWLSSRLFSKNLSQWRKRSLGLPEYFAVPQKPARTLYAYSRFLVPRPKDWGQDVHVTGTWWLDEPNWKPSPELDAFLSSGPPPVYVGFGSMPSLGKIDLTTLLVEAISRLGKRAILATGGGALGNVAASPNLFLASRVPHDQLFPHVDAVIHHGGAGTTAAALRAGKPSVICPFFGDQPFWAHRVHSLGAAPPALDLKRLTVDKVVTAIRAMDDPHIRSRASQLGSEMRSEGGVRDAIGILEELDRLQSLNSGSTSPEKR